MVENFDFLMIFPIIKWYLEHWGCLSISMGFFNGKPWIPMDSPGWSHRRRWTFLGWALRLGQDGERNGAMKALVNDRWMTGEGDLKSDVCCYRWINDDKRVYIICIQYVYIYIMYTSWNWTLFFARLFWTRQRVLSHGFIGYVRVTTRVYVD